MSAARWQLPGAPAHWLAVPGWGMRGVAGHAAGSNICVKEDTLLAGKQLEPYVRTQITLMKRHFDQPAFSGPQPTAALEAAGAEEALLLLIRHRPLDGREVVQMQAYARVGLWIGIATLTTLRSSVVTLRTDFEQFLQAIRVLPGI